MGNRFSDLNCAFEIKSEGENIAKFTGIASTSDEDLEGDIIQAGAFDPIPTKRGPEGLIPDVIMLRDHDRSEIIGGWRSFEQRGKQLHVEGELALEVAKARETHALMKKGYLSGLSVGFRVKSIHDIDFDEKSGKRTIKKATLRECSIVGFPANTRARVLNVKSALDELLGEESGDLLERLERIEARLTAALSKGGDDKASKPPDVKANESRETYIARCLESMGGGNGAMTACNKAWANHSKDDGGLIKAIDGFKPIDGEKVAADLRGLLEKVKGYRHV